MLLAKQETELRKQLVDSLGTKKAFRLRRVKRHGQWLFFLALARRRLQVSNGNLHYLQRHLGFNFSANKVTLIGRDKDIEHALSRLLSFGEIVVEQSQPKQKPLPCRRTIRPMSSVALAH